MILCDILNRIELLFPKVPRHTEEDDEEIVRRVIMRYAQDNMYLSRGKYLTGKDIEKMRVQIIRRRSYNR